MSLLVDDFGCRPDGRFLERIAISASSAVLSDPDGTLRSTDVGKNISIPGAIDLVATIADLIDRKDVAIAAMTAGNTTLTATFNPKEEGFRADLHLGLRITVAGAGPAGSTLLSNVVAVLNRTTIRLVDAASTTVANALAILNRQDRVALSDYARASTAGVTVDLGNRTIVDGAMIVGQRGLTSETAKFSSLDLGKSVTILLAGRLVTTIQSFTSQTQVTLAAPAQRTVQSGLADVWQTDSRPGLESLLASLDQRDVEAVEIVFNSGVYDFTRGPVPSPSSGAIGLVGLRNLTLRGAGIGATIVRLMPNQDLHGPDTHVIEMIGCRRLTLRDLSVHGAYLTLDRVNEQMHGIQVAEGCEEIDVERVRVFQSSGDGIRLLGEGGDGTKPPNLVRQVRVDNCSFVQNKRTGVGFQRAAEQVWVHNCYIEMTPPSTDSCIDFEPSAPHAPADVIIDSNFIVHGTNAAAVSLTGFSETDPARGIKFINNTLRGGAVEGVNAQDVLLANNTIEAGIQGPIVRFQGAYDRLRIESNKIVATGQARPAILVEQRNKFAPSDIVIENNHVESPGDGILLQSPGSHVHVRNNRIFGPGNFFGINVVLDVATIGLHRDIKIVGNTISDFLTAGIHVATFNTSERFEGVAIEGNEILIPGDLLPGLAGIVLAKPGGGTDNWLLGAIVAENRIADTFRQKIDRDGRTVPFIGISGNLGGRAVFEGDGSPEGVVVAPFGSLFIRVDAEAHTTLFLKKTGIGATGWVAIG